MITTCPNSIPILNSKREIKKCDVGRPISLRAFANPIPCIKPNIKTIANRQIFKLLCMIFSMDVNKIEIAISGSTILELGTM